MPVLAVFMCCRLFNGMIDAQIKRMTEVTVDESEATDFSEQAFDGIPDDLLADRISSLTSQEVETIDRLMYHYPNAVPDNKVATRRVRRRVRPDETVGDWLHPKAAGTIVSRIKRKLGSAAIITVDESFGDQIIRRYKAGPTLVRLIAPERLVREVLSSSSERQASVVPQVTTVTSEAPNTAAMVASTSVVPNRQGVIQGLLGVIGTTGLTCYIVGFIIMFGSC